MFDARRRTVLELIVYDAHIPNPPWAFEVLLQRDNLQITHCGISKDIPSDHRIAALGSSEIGIVVPKYAILDHGTSSTHLIHAGQAATYWYCYRLLHLDRVYKGRRAIVARNTRTEML